MLQDTDPFKIGETITVTCDDGYVVSPPTPPEAAGFLGECLQGQVWRYTTLDGAAEYASAPKCSNMKFCPVCTYRYVKNVEG